MSALGLRDLVRQIAPPWLASGVAEKLLYVVGLGADACLEKLNQGMRLHMPTYGDNSALPYVGADRIIPRGLVETESAYATRLKYWLDDWQIAGSVRAVMQQVLGVLTPVGPLIRAVSDSSVWDTWLPGSNPQTSYPSHYAAANNWNWDGEADPHAPGKNAWWRWWLVLFSDMSPVGGPITAATNATPIAITTTNPHLLSSGATVWVTGVNGNLGANSPNGDADWTITVTGGSTFTLNGSVGTGAYTAGGTVYMITDPITKPTSYNWIRPGPVLGAPGVLMGDGRYAMGFSLAQPLLTAIRAIGVRPNAGGLFSSIKAIVNLWKGAQSWCRWTIVSFDNGRFDPARTADGTHNPDGTWGPWLKIVTINNIPQYVPARSNDARYCDPVA